MTFEEIRLLIPQYLSGQLTPSDQDLFETQLSQNAELRAETEELRTLWNQLGLLSEEQPSVAMRARFYQRLNALQRHRDLHPGTKSVPWRLGLWQQVAAALGVFLLGLFVGRFPTGGSVPANEVAQLRSQVQSLHETVALSLLDRQSAASRLEGVAWSSRIQQPDGELLSALITTLNRDPNINVRLASLDALEKFAGNGTVRKALVDSLYAQNSPLVQIALIDALVHMRDTEAAKPLQKLSRDNAVNVTVRQRAEWGLEKLSFQ
jgi:HEAT repeat protein